MTVRVIGIACLIAMLALAGTSWGESAARSKALAPADGTLNPEEAALFDARLNQIADTNQRIDARLDQIVEEVQLVKVRASVKHSHDDDND